VALGRNSQRIALLSLFGGFLTPYSSAKGRTRNFLQHLLTLGAGLLVIEMRRDWRWLNHSFPNSAILFLGWYSEFIVRISSSARIFCHAFLFSLRRSSGHPSRAVSRLRELDTLGSS